MNAKNLGPWDGSQQVALWRSTALGKWDEVIEIYKNYPESHEFTIDKYCGDTAIHLAVSDQQHSKVKKMVTIVGSKVLATKNNQGNTPLHLAASLGSTDICQCIVKKDSSLTRKFNDDGETPLFLAVANGNMDAFRYLHGYCKDEEYLRRKNGDTILHAAISGQYFDIAYCISHQYPKLVHMVNKKGGSPLHLLAAMPSAFQSGNPLFGLSKLIYRCIPVGKLEQRLSKFLNQNAKGPRDASLVANNGGKLERCSALMINDGE